MDMAIITHRYVDGNGKYRGQSAAGARLSFGATAGPAKLYQEPKRCPWRAFRCPIRFPPWVTWS